MMTFEEFQATRTECDDIGAAIGADMSLPDGRPTAGFLYLGKLYITKADHAFVDEPHTRYWLQTDPPSEYLGDNLGELERRLYDWAIKEGYDAPLYRREFGDFPATDWPIVPAGFEDNSWHNNSAPSIENRALGLNIWINYSDESLREIPGGKRFLVSEIEPEYGGFVGNEAILETDDWAAVLALIAATEKMWGMHIFYTSDGEESVSFTLGNLLANFRFSKTDHDPHAIGRELTQRGWYTGIHEEGAYLILNRDLLKIESHAHLT